MNHGAFDDRALMHGWVGVVFLDNTDSKVEQGLVDQDTDIEELPEHLVSYLVGCHIDLPIQPTAALLGKNFAADLYLVSSGSGVVLRGLFVNILATLGLHFGKRALATKSFSVQYHWILATRDCFLQLATGQLTTGLRT